MNELKKLNIPYIFVEKNANYSTEYVNVIRYKYLRITVFSEQPMNMYAVFSIDSVEKGLVQNFKIVGKKWETFRLEIISPYLKFECVNGNEDNKKLLVNVLGRNDMMPPEKHVKIEESIIPKPLEIIEDELIIHEPEPMRPKSPFRRFVASKLNSPKKEEMRDARLPELMLKGNMFFVSATNKISTIPAPNDNLEYHLCWINGTPQWRLINEWRI
jgi:hypothetical protein